MIVAALLSALALAPSQGRLAVLNLVPRTGVSFELAQIVSDLVVNEVRQRAAGRKVISQGDLKDLMTLQRTKERLGCTDLACLAEIGGAMGAEEMVSGTLAVLGDSYILTLRRLDVRRATALHEGSVTRPRGNDAVLASAVTELVASLFAIDSTPARAEAIAPARAEVDVPAGPPTYVAGPATERPVAAASPRSHVASVACLSVGAALVAAAIVGTVEVVDFGAQKGQTGAGQTIPISQGYTAQASAIWGLALAIAGYPIGASGIIAGAVLW